MRWGVIGRASSRASALLRDGSSGLRPSIAGLPTHARASGQRPSKPQRHHACVGARLRAMGRYREDFIARERAPTRQFFRPDAFDCRAFPRTHARRGNNHPDCSDLRSYAAFVAVFVDARHACHITQLAPPPKASRRCTACMTQRQATLPLPATARVPKRPTLQQPPGTALANPHSRIPNPSPQNASFPSRTSTSINEVSASIASSSRLSAIQPA